MLKSLPVLAAGALALLVVSSTFDAADARGRGGGGGGRGFSGGHGFSSGRAFSGGARFYGGGAYRARSFAVAPIHRHRHFRRGIIVGAPLAYGAYYYGSGCEWLRRRAAYTGSGYWWDRYYACVNGYY
jgi:hypothetical protein